MAKPDPWPIIEAERIALADDLERLDDQQWGTPSMCEGWTVHEVLGHMASAARTTPPKFFVHMIKSGFAFGKMAQAEVDKETAHGPMATLKEFRQLAPSRAHPPGPVDTWLGETLVHAEDIRRPLGIAHAYPKDAAARVADFYKGSNLIIGAKKRVSGLTLRATDTDWSTGDGPVVEGPIMALVLAMTGRKAGLSDLTGPGVDDLRVRP